MLNLMLRMSSVEFDIEDEQRCVEKIIKAGLQAIVIIGQIRARAESGTEVFQNVSIDEILS